MSTNPDTTTLEARLVEALLSARFGGDVVGYMTARVAREALAPALVPVVQAEIRAELLRLHDAIAGTDMERYDVLVLLSDRKYELDPQDGAQ